MAAYTYDAEGKLSGISGNGEETSYSYDELGRLSLKLLPNGVSTEYSYLPGGNLESMTSYDSKGELDKYFYTYDNAGLISGINRSRRGLEAVSGQYDYKYDVIGRLTESSHNGQVKSAYEYDAFGNRTSLVEENTKTAYKYDVLDRLVEAKELSNSQAIVKTYSYDKRGNQTKEFVDGLLQKTFTFDATNMLSKVVDSKKGEVENQYNGLGFRVASTRPEEKIEYLCDLSRDYYNLLERTVNGETESFIYDNNVVSMSKSGNNYYYLQDELGSPMYMTGIDGVAVSSYAFDDFGRNVDPFTGKIKEAGHKHAYTTDGNIIQPFAFKGYQEDEVSGLKFAQARFYDANTGRFQSEDNVKGFANSPFTLNHYGYCWGNPVGLVDRDGNLPTFVNNIGEFISENKEQIVGISISVVGVVAGIAATAVLTPMLGPAGPVVGGMIGGAISGGLQSVGQQMAAGGVNNISAKEVVIDTIAGGIGGAIGGVGASGFTARAGKTLIGASIDGIAEATKSFADDGHITKDELYSAMKTVGASMIYGAASEGISSARTRRINKKNLTPDSVSEKLLDELDDSLDGNGKVTKLKDKINTKKAKISADEYWAEHGATKKARSRAATAVKRYRKQLEATEKKLWNLREGKWRERLIFKQEYITTPLIVNNIKNIYELCQED